MSQYPNRDPNAQPYGPDPSYPGRATGYGGPQPPSGPHPNSPPPGAHPQAGFNPNTPNPLTSQPEAGAWYNPPTRNDPYAPTTPDFELASRLSSLPPHPRPESMDTTPPPQPSVPVAVSRQNGLNKKLIATVLALILLIGATILAATLAHRNQDHASTNITSSVYPFSNHLALSDPMTDNSHAAQEGWTEDGTNCFFANGTYHTVVPRSSSGKACWAPYTTFTNFTYQVQMVFKQGGNDAIGGLIFRAHIGTGQYYYLLLHSQGRYAFRMSTGYHSPTQLIQRNRIPSFVSNPDQPHTLGIVARGNHISLYVDQRRMTEFTDSHYTNGEIGVLALTNKAGNAVEVDYSNLKVWTL